MIGETVDCTWTGPRYLKSFFHAAEPQLTSCKACSLFSPPSRTTELVRDRDNEISSWRAPSSDLFNVEKWFGLGAGNRRLVGSNGAQTPAVVFMDRSPILPLSTLSLGLPLLHLMQNAAGLKLCSKITASAQPIHLVILYGLVSGSGCPTSQVVTRSRLPVPSLLFPPCCLLLQQKDPAQVVFGAGRELRGAAGPLTCSVRSNDGCEQGALNTSPVVWHLTRVKSVFPPTVCLEFLPSDEAVFA